MSITSILSIALGAILVENFILVKFLGICPFMGVSKKMDTALGMGLAVVFVMGLASIFTWLVNEYLLVPLGLAYMQTVAYILVIAALVQFVEMFIKKTSPALYRALGIFLPLITTNCAILGLALLIPSEGYNFIESVIFAFAAGVGFTLAIVLMAGLRENLEFADVPGVLKGVPITLIIAGIMAMAFMGFSGLISM